MDMNTLISDYATFVDRGVSLDPDVAETRIELGCFGLAGEAGEVIDLIKKVKLHGKELDRDALVKELGDVAWYYTLLLSTFNISLEEVMLVNIRKLVERYPERHPELAAIYLPDTDDLHDAYGDQQDHGDVNGV